MALAHEYSKAKSNGILPIFSFLIILGGISYVEFGIKLRWFLSLVPRQWDILTISMTGTRENDNKYANEAMRTDITRVEVVDGR